MKKRIYMAPAMRTVQVRHKARILQTSGGPLNSTFSSRKAKMNATFEEENWDE